MFRSACATTAAAVVAVAVVVFVTAAAAVAAFGGRQVATKKGHKQTGPSCVIQGPFST